MVTALVTFSVRFHWSGIRSEDGRTFIVFSQPSMLGVYFAAASLVCGIVWFVLAIGFEAGHVSKHDQPRSGGM
jgi:hypothetical protein